MMLAVATLAGLFSFAGPGGPVDTRALIRSGDYEAAISILEKELKGIEEAGTSDEAITESLKGLGYIS